MYSWISSYDIPTILRVFVILLVLLSPSYFRRKRFLYQNFISLMLVTHLFQESSEQGGIYKKRQKVTLLLRSRALQGLCGNCFQSAPKKTKVSIFVVTTVFTSSSMCQSFRTFSFQHSEVFFLFRSSFCSTSTPFRWLVGFLSTRVSIQFVIFYT